MILGQHDETGGSGPAENPTDHFLLKTAGGSLILRIAAGYSAAVLFDRWGRGRKLGAASIPLAVLAGAAVSFILAPGLKARTTITTA